jgi:hypothetical protein
MKFLSNPRPFHQTLFKADIQLAVFLVAMLASLPLS